MRSNSYDIEKKDVIGGEILKKIIFESQRQMARTLLDKTAREDHSLSKNIETRMLIAQASQKAAKTLKAEELKVKLATATHPGTIGIKNFERIGTSKETHSNADPIYEPKEPPKEVIFQKPAVTCPKVLNESNPCIQVREIIEADDIIMSSSKKTNGSAGKEIPSINNNLLKRELSTDITSSSNSLINQRPDFMSKLVPADRNKNHENGES